jgi:hypothetical protein
MEYDGAGQDGGGIKGGGINGGGAMNGVGIRPGGNANAENGGYGNVNAPLGACPAAALAGNGGTAPGNGVKYGGNAAPGAASAAGKVDELVDGGVVTGADGFAGVAPASLVDGFSFSP